MDIRDKVDQTFPHEKFMIMAKSKSVCHLVHLNQLLDMLDNDEEAHPCAERELRNPLKVIPNNEDLAPFANGISEHLSDADCKITRTSHVVCAMCNYFNLLAGSRGNWWSTKT